jgi:hypothetical protein
MLQHVSDVIVEDEAQGQRRRVSNGTGSQPVGILGCLRCRQQLAVQCRPQADQALPFAVLIAMQRDPSIAIVTRHGRFFLQLSADDSLMVVGGRVQQMAKLLFWRPDIRRRLVLNFVGRKHAKAARQVIDQLTQQLQAFHLAPRKTMSIISQHGFPVPQDYTV